MHTCLTESSEEPDVDVLRYTVHKMIHKLMAKSVKPPAKTASIIKSIFDQYHHQGNIGLPIPGEAELV